MRKAEVVIGSVYIAKISNVLTRVKITNTNPYGGWDAVNLATNRVVRIRSAMKLRGLSKRQESDNA